jgi:hypothetical protein
VEARRLTAALDPQKLGPVPERLTAKAEALWQPPLSRIILDLTHRSLHYVAHALTAPFIYFAVEPSGATPHSSPVVQAPSQLTFRLDAEQVSIRVTTVAARDGITLTLTVYGDRHELLPGTRVQFRQGGLEVFSVKTDAQGQLHVPYTSPGVYDVVCPQLQTTFQLDLRSAPEHG